MKLILQKILFLFVLFCASQSLRAQHDTLRAKALFDDGMAFFDDGEYAAARKPFQEALAIQQKYFGANHVKVEDTYYWLGAVEEDIRNNEKAIEYFQKGVAIARKRKGEKSIAVADFYIEIGNTYDQMYDVKKAKEYYLKVLDIYKKKYGAESSQVGNAYMNMGVGQRKMGNYRNSEEYFKKAYANFQKSSSANSKDFYRIYLNQSVLLLVQGNYDKALDYARKSLKIKLMHYDTLHPGVYKYFGHIGDILQAKGAPRDAIPYAEKALDICLKTRGPEHPETAGLMGVLANLYADLGQLEEALKLNKKAVKIQEKGLPPNHPYLVAAYSDIGFIYKKQKKWNKALKFYQDALARYQKAVDVPIHFVVDTKGDIAGIYFAKGEVEKALSIIEDALEQIAPELKPVDQNPPLDKIQAEDSVLELLRSKAIFLQTLYQKSKKKRDIEQALQTSELAIRLIEKIRKSYQSESARQFLNEQTAPIFDHAIEQAFELYQLTKDADYLFKAFNLSEKSKANILWQSLNNQYALEASAIPADQLEKIQLLALQIADLEEEALEAESETKKKLIQEQIIDFKIAYENLILDLEQYNSAYYQLKYASADTNLKQLQDHLAKEKTTMVEYFYTDQNLYTFVVSSTDLEGFRQALSFDLSEQVRSLRDNDVHSVVFQNHSQKTYISALNQLYETLIQPILPSLQSEQKLLFVPHGVLQYLSFESLAPPSSQASFKNLDYLLKSFVIQYHWSAALWANSPKRSTHTEHDFLGFAPDFGSRSTSSESGNSMANYRQNLAALKHSQPELEGASRFFSGKLYTDTAATESNFRKWCPQSKIIHLATHARVDDHLPMQSGLLFSAKGDHLEDGILQAAEIYNLNLSADLAVMSACNTGFGKFSKGEGIMSLGRAFLYAGCKSVMMSLWLANDESASSIVQGFYQYADQGLGKDRALRKSKLDYLQAADPLTAHPYFWANLVAVGDMSPLRNSGMPNYYWWLAAILGMGLLFLLAGRNLQKSQ